MTSSRSTAIRVLLPILVIVVIAVGALYFVRAEVGPPRGAAASSDQTDPSAGGGAGDTAVGATIPDFSLTTLEGKSATFSQVSQDAGAKVVLVNFWATWCEACMDEMPSLVQLRDSFKSKGFEVIGINLDENPSVAVPRAEKELGIKFPVFSDASGKIADYFDVHAIPLSVVVGVSGNARKILYIENGEQDWNDKDIRQQLEHWLSERT